MSYQRLVHALLFELPYFGSALRARQGDVARHKYFLPILKAVLQQRPGPISMLEIGAWAGCSTVSWAKGLEALGRGGTITCVDQWQPYFDNELDSNDIYVEMNEAARQGDVLRLFLHNLRASGVDSYVQYRMGPSREVLKYMADASFNLIYIDGGHRYDIVKGDIEDSIRLISDGGIICGDDLELQQSQIDPDEHARLVASGGDCVLANSAKSDYHPGVTAAVAEAFGEVSAWDGFWAIRKQGGTWTPVELALASTVVPPHLLVDGPVETVAPELVQEDYKGFNLVCVDRIYGIPLINGPFDVGEALQRGYQPFLHGITVAEVKAKIDRLRPALLEKNYKRYALYQIDQVYGIPIGEGPIDIVRAPAGRYEVIFHGLTVDTVKAEIDSSPPQLIEE